MTTDKIKITPELLEEIHQEIRAERGMAPQQQSTEPEEPRKESLLDEVKREMFAEKGLTYEPPTSSTPLNEDPDRNLLTDIGDYAKKSLTSAHDAWKSVGTGAAKAVFETKDFIAGEPEEHEKSGIRKGLEATSKRLTQGNPINSIVEGISQFSVGLLGAGKLVAPIKVVQKLKQAGKAGQAAFEVARGAAVGAVVIDPHEERLSNLIQDYPALENPVTEFLAASEDDSAAMGRLKNALEGIGLDLAIVGTFAAGVKALKAFKSGDAQTIELANLEHADLELGQSDLSPVPIDLSMDKRTIETPTERIDVDAVNVPENLRLPPSGSSDSTIPTLSQADVTIGSILENARTDTKALQLYGSKEAAIVGGHKFSKEAPLPWQKLTGSDEIREFLKESSDELLDSHKSTIHHPDVLSDPQVVEMVQARAILFNEQPSDVMGQLAQAGQNASTMVADMEASFLLANKMLQDTYDTAFKIRNGMLGEWGNDVATAHLEIKNRFTASSEMLGTAMNMRSSAGRSMRRLRGQFQIKPEDLEAISKLDGDALSKMLYASGGDPKKMVEAANPSFIKRVLDETTYSLTNSLLWMYTTHVVNLTSNVYMLAARPTEKALGSLVMGTKASAIRQAAMKEYAYTLSGLGDGWTSAVEAFKRGDSILSPHTDEYLGPQHSALTFAPVGSTDALLENTFKYMNYRNIVGLPTRALGSIDEFIKTLRYRAVVQAKAAVEANQQGLIGREANDYVAAKLRSSFDLEGRGTDKDALQEAQITTFQQELKPDTLGATIRNARTSHPSLGLILPFIKTPVNVLRHSWKMTPGLNLLQGEYRKMLMGDLGKEAQAHAAGQMSLGATFMAIAASLALEDKMTGGGPSDPKLLANLRATGWQPYSLVIENDEGTKTYMPLGRIDPIGLAMGMVTDLVDMARSDPEGRTKSYQESGMGSLLIALASNFSDKTFLLNLNFALRALSDPETHGAKFVGQMVGNTLPLSSLMRGLNPDPYLREARGFIDSIKKNLPAFSETLPPRRDVYGEPIWRRIGLSTTDESDFVEAEHNRIMIETGMGVRTPSPVKHGVDLRDVTLSNGRNAFDYYQELAFDPLDKPDSPKTLKGALSRLIKSKGYSNLVDGESTVKGTKLAAISDVVRDYM